MSFTGDDPYRDPVLYDLEYADQTEDIAYYVQRAKAARGPVLELGCGTGRLTLPIARAGVTVTGIDRSLDMLAGLRDKLSREPEEVRSRVRLHAADYIAVDAIADEAFNAVLWPFNAIHHCTTQEEISVVLSRARRWAPTGPVHLDCYLPDPQLYSRDPNARFEPRSFVHPVTGQTLESWEQGAWDEERRIHHVHYVYRATDGKEAHAHLQLHMYELPEIEALIARAGYRVARVAQDFNGTPIGRSSLKWVSTLLRT